MKKMVIKKWVDKGTPWVWLNAGAIAISIIMVVGLLGLIAVKGLSHFWPKPIFTAVYQADDKPYQLIGELVETEAVDHQRLVDLGVKVPPGFDEVQRHLVKTGNREVYGTDFRWVLGYGLIDMSYPAELVLLERTEWGNFYGYLVEVRESGKPINSDSSQWSVLVERLQRAQELQQKIDYIEKDEIGVINYEVERLRLKTRSLELKGQLTADRVAEISLQRAQLDEDYEVLQARLNELYIQIRRDSVYMEAMDGSRHDIALVNVVRTSKPNSLNFSGKVSYYLEHLHEFVFADPREANTEGGVFPAIFGTVMMVMLMSVMVTPFGVVAAIYLREYAKQGTLTRIIRIAVNNLAGVPSIVYGVFGLGFFVYFLGGSIDELFYPESSPAPVFGTPGLLWASLTLALLTLPVVIVATEEGLARIPRSLREGSLALGATKAETLWRVVLPMASPAMMTGLILAIARAAGEVAPLMLVGVVKLAPSLPIDGNFPYVHLERKFMHLGFHIYDVGFQSPNVEAARPLVYATALLLVIVIASLNLTAVMLRNRLRERYKALEN